MTHGPWPHALLLAGAAALTTDCASDSTTLVEDAVVRPIVDSSAQAAGAGDRAALATPTARRPAGVDYSTDLEAAAPDVGEPEDGGNWRHVVSLYAWVPNYKGGQRIGGIDVEPALTRSDVLNNTDISFSGRYEIRAPRSDWSFWMDVFWAQLGDDDSADTAIDRVDADIEARMAFVEAAAVMRYWQSETLVRVLDRELPSASIDFYGGARYARLRTKVALQAKAVGAKFKYDETEDWIDPMIGSRVGYSLTPRMWLIVRGDIGGFDVGSHRAWLLRGTLQYVITERMAIGAGWQVMDLDYNDGSRGFKADVRMGGPFAMLSYEF